eukprot:g66999.t1
MSDFLTTWGGPLAIAAAVGVAFYLCTGSKSAGAKPSAAPSKASQAASGSSGPLKFKADVEAAIPGVVVTGEPTRETTGAFEIQVVGGPLVHSKLGGEGYVTEANVHSVIDKIKAYASKNE